MFPAASESPANVAGDKPTVSLMNVTPQMASLWLQNDNTKNRTLIDSHAQRLARDIKEGRWMLTHEGIAFSSDGVLLDGQHRLQAIVIANMPVSLYVWRGVSPDSLLAINRGAIRSLADSLSLSGACGQVSKSQVATLQAMIGGLKGPATLTPTQAQQLFIRHRAAIEFAHEHLAGHRVRGVATAITRAVIARAWYSSQIDRLTQFCNVLTTGMATSPGDETVVALFKYLVHSRTGGEKYAIERYSKVERAIYCYLLNVPVTRLFTVNEEHFPIPEENKGKEAA